MKLALIGYGHVGKAFARLLERQRAVYPFRIVAIHTARHGSAFDAHGLGTVPEFGPPAATIEEYLERAGAEVALEITPLNPATGEPAISHIRAAFARGLHVITANKGPIAHAYRSLCAEAARAGVEFRFESTVMDGAPVFSLMRHSLPGVEMLGITGVLNSTSKVVVEAMEEGCSMEEGIERARKLGIAEADAGFDIDGWDSAAKTAALANVLMQAETSPQAVSTRGIRRLTPQRLQALAAQGKTIRLVSRARRTPHGVRLRVRGEVLDRTDILASVPGTSNVLLFHTDLMGTIGTVSISPTVEQTAYGLFSDLVDVAKAV